MFEFLNRSKEHTAKIVPLSDTPTDSITLTVERGKTLLNAALGSGIDWPHKCKVGSCGTCKCRIISGTVKPQIDFSYVLSPDELDNGFVLACQSELKTDVQVQVKLRKRRKVT